jgi:TPP-dependent pyruvate/acetoin dehydrogenase alpha subunit
MRDGVLSEDAVAEIDAAATARIDEAVAYAEAQEYPAETDALLHVFGPPFAGATAGS